MTMTRTFQPVGQGLFCTEKFDTAGESKYNVVYDCGSDSLSHDEIESVVFDSFAQGEVVDAVYISHFDRDHVNGLPILLRRCTVKKVFLPVVTSPAEVAYWRFKCLVQLESDKKKGFHLVVVDRLLALDSANVADVFKYLGAEEPPAVEHVDAVSQVEQNPLVSAQPILKFDRWVFAPFNFRREERDAIFREVFAEALNPLNVDVGSFINDTAGVVRDLNQEVADKLLSSINKGVRAKLGSTNGSSMTLYSGEDPLVGVAGTVARCLCDNTMYKAGCLYLGDYEAKKRMPYRALKKHYESLGVWDGIGCVQLPHHGSRYDYNKMLEVDGRCYAVSFGLGNRNHHPGKEVVFPLLQRNRTVMFSTEANRYIHKNDIVQKII